MTISEEQLKERLATLDDYLRTHGPTDKWYADASTERQLCESALKHHYPNAMVVPLRPVHEDPPYGRFDPYKGLPVVDTPVGGEPTPPYVPQQGTVTPLHGAPTPNFAHPVNQPAILAVAPTMPPKKSYELPSHAKVGICIGTHGSAPYIHLQLEAIRRYNPDVSVLIHDDCSSETLRLHELCAQYGAKHVATPYRLNPTVGDTSAFVAALDWAKAKGLDIVVKCSRRMVIAKPWADGLRDIFENMQYATVCAADAHYGFGFRSELVAMNVRAWTDSTAVAEMAEVVRMNRQPDPLPEAWLHHRARDVHRFAKGELLAKYEQHYPRHGNCEGYADWPIMGLSRHQKIDGVLWHDAATPADYAALAAKWGLPYNEQDFVIVPGE